MPKDHEAITVDGQFPRLDLLRIDLTNGVLKKDFRPHQFKKPSAPQPTVFTKQFEYIARPLRYEDGVIEMHITARDAEMSLIRDGDQASLVLTDAARRFLAKCVLSRGASKRLPRSLLEGVGWDAVEWIFSFSRTFASSVFSLQRGCRQIWSKLGFELAS